MKFSCLFVIVLACLAMSVNARKHSLKKEIAHINGAYLELLDKVYATGDSLSASPLTPLDTSLDACHPQSTQQQQCSNQITQLTAEQLTGDHFDDVDQALSGIDDWMSAFEKRIGTGQTLWSAAEAVVAPLLARLRRRQHQAVQRLIESNDAIWSHVQEVATEHVYNLLRASSKKHEKIENEAKRQDEKRAILDELEMKKAELRENMEKPKLNSTSTSKNDKSAAKAANNEEKKLEDEVKKALGM